MNLRPRRMQIEVSGFAGATFWPQQESLDAQTHYSLSFIMVDHLDVHHCSFEIGIFNSQLAEMSQHSAARLSYDCRSELDS